MLRSVADPSRSSMLPLDCPPPSPLLVQSAEPCRGPLLAAEHFWAERGDVGSVDSALAKPLGTLGAGVSLPLVTATPSGTTVAPRAAAAAAGAEPPADSLPSGPSPRSAPSSPSLHLPGSELTLTSLPSEACFAAAGRFLLRRRRAQSRAPRHTSAAAASAPTTMPAIAPALRPPPLVSSSPRGLTASPTWSSHSWKDDVPGVVTRTTLQARGARGQHRRARRRVRGSQPGQHGHRGHRSPVHSPADRTQPRPRRRSPAGDVAGHDGPAAACGHGLRHLAAGLGVRQAAAQPRGLDEHLELRDGAVAVVACGGRHHGQHNHAHDAAVAQINGSPRCRERAGSDREFAGHQTAAGRRMCQAGGGECSWWRDEQLPSRQLCSSGGLHARQAAAVGASAWLPHVGAWPPSGTHPCRCRCRPRRERRSCCLRPPPRQRC